MKYLIVSLVIAVNFMACSGPDARVEHPEAVDKTRIREEKIANG